MWDTDIQDNNLFNEKDFSHALAAGTPPLTIYKESLQNCRQILSDEFHAAEPVKLLVHKGAWFIDQLLTQAWRWKIDSADISLVAVGGYGRGELHPGSDIDIMVLTKPRPKPEIKQQIESFLVFLWDIGLEIGHSVRTIRDCKREAKADITVATNLMEARLLAGSQTLFEAMCKVTGPNKIWPTRKFFKAKWSEQMNRHHKYDETEHKLEPNIKEGPGGLRDIQMIGWVAKRHFGATRLHELVDHGFLTEDEYNSLDAGRSFLWRVRFALHLQSGRREDRLLFDHQRQVAMSFGYSADDNSGIEQFMKMYYRTVRELNRLNEMLLQHFQEAIIYARRREKIRPLNRRFQIRNDFIEVSGRNVFKRYPFALLELFLLIQQTPRVQGVRASTIRLVRESIDLIDDDFRQDIRNKSLFMEIIRQPHLVGHELRRMHRYGILGAYMPEFAAIEGQMQFDLFHIYTVDEHTLFVVRNMRLFGLIEYREKFPHCSSVLQSIPKQELLYLAGMFHDIAKGRGGSHSELGARDALEFCRRHQLPEFDSKLVAWLVKNHLIMSKTAQREDINDPEVVNNFAIAVRDIIHLNYLYLLTVADICGTNPNLWNSWKDELIAELYQKTLRALRRGLENLLDKTQRIRETKEEALHLIKTPGTDQQSIEQLWSYLSDDYFIRHSPDEIAWQARVMAKAGAEKIPTVTIREKANRGGTGIFIYMPDHDHLFSRTTMVLDKLGLNIVDARIITSSKGYTLDTFIVLEQSGENVKDRTRIKQIKEILTRELASLDKTSKPVSRIKSRQLKNFPIPTRISFTPDANNSRTIMEVTTTDRPGLLSIIGQGMEFCGVRLQGAKIATYGERVEDIFFITDYQNLMITDEIKFECLRNSIIEALEAK